MEIAYANAANRHTRKRNKSSIDPKKVCVFDIETDPFKHGRKPEAFAVGFFDGENYVDFWGEDCIRQFAQYTSGLAPCYLYAHNGGRFDFYYIFEWLQNPLKIINGRIVSAHFGDHVVRDSYAILPVPLATFGKDEIDYEKFERQARENHRAEILSYLRRDCVSLFDAVSSFIARFGIRLTIGSAAISELQKLHPFERRAEAHDLKFRDYYLGGRVQCFEAGSRRGRFKVFDVNSMYPHVMRSFNHPTGKNYVLTSSLAEARSLRSPYFAEIEYDSHGPIGALPVRTRNGSIAFPSHGRVRSFATGHEIDAGLSLGLIPSNAICHRAFVATEQIQFRDFVDKFALEKALAKKRDDVAGYTFAKLILNSAYGKFGSNPANYKDYYIWIDGEPMPPGDDWELHSDYGWLTILERPSRQQWSSFFDVATAASITGAARSVLLRALAQAERPVYCDTDSIICENLAANIHPVKLGAWKLEAEGDRVLIGGKKLYALKRRSKFVKLASKGVELTGPEIECIVSRGGEITYTREAPTFRLSGETEFITRRVRCTI